MSDLDFSAIVDEIVAEAQRRRDSGEFSVETLERLDAEFDRFAPLTYRRTGIDGAIRAVESASFINVEVPTDASRKPFHYVKEAIKRGTAWYHLHVARQVTTLGIQVTRPLRMLHEAQQALTNRVASLGTSSGPAAELLAEIGRGGCPAPALDPQVVEAVAGAAAGAIGRVLMIGVDEAQAIAVRDAGCDAYTVSPLGDVHHGEVRHEPALDHLRRIADHALGAVVIANSRVDTSGAVERMALVYEAVRCIGPGGRLIVAAAEPGAWADNATGVAIDLAPGRPWSEDTWRAVFERLGCRSETVQRVGQALVVVASIA